MKAKPPIFRGELSNDLWKDIDHIIHPTGGNPGVAQLVWQAVYSLACRCQELEHRLEEYTNRKPERE